MSEAGVAQDVMEVTFKNSRRFDRRYPLHLQGKWKLIKRRRVEDSGTGTTVDLSHGGVSFEADHSNFPVGLFIELSLDWPAKLGGIVPMHMVIVGRILRSESNRVALKMLTHEFRTAGLPLL